jgi:hypothetical protein
MNQGYSYYFCMMIEGSRSGAGAGAGSIRLTNGSGSGSRRPKTMWIRWIRIRNTGLYVMSIVFPEIYQYSRICCLINKMEEEQHGIFVCLFTHHKHIAAKQF